VIPARMAATRFPGKPLVPIAGRPMLAWCHEGAARSDLLDEVVVATCDDEIREWAEGEGIPAVMTSDRHVRATDRVAEAAKSIDADAFVLIQGDEPLVSPTMIDAALRPVLEGRARCTNLMKRLVSREELESPHLVKVVTDLSGRALYLSRSPIPTTLHKGFDGIAAYNQVAIFGFDRETLLLFPQLDSTPYEIAESVDMMRFVEHGVPIHFVESTERTHSVDVPEDVAVVERMLAAAR
jgi:3-deoxy-manno-octulosonate cytidylyltransferase (CMP-KDO synthetase)